MTIRGAFDTELRNLRQKLLELGSLSEIAVAKSINAFQNSDVLKAEEVISDDSRIDLLEEQINNLAINLLARQSPVAIDLRRIIVALKISSNLERVGDLAKDISKSTIRMTDRSIQYSDRNLQSMGQVAIEMLSLSLKAYIEEDVVLAKKIGDMDDKVDHLYGIMLQEIIKISSYQNHSQEYINQISQLSFVARYIERIADYTTNISEHVFYLVKGIRYELN